MEARNCSSLSAARPRSALQDDGTEGKQSSRAGHLTLVDANRSGSAKRRRASPAVGSISDASPARSHTDLQPVRPTETTRAHSDADLAAPASVGDLPDGVLALAFDLLPLRDRLAAAAVCARWRAVARELPARLDLSPFRLIREEDLAFLLRGAGAGAHVHALLLEGCRALTGASVAAAAAGGSLRHLQELDLSYAPLSASALGPGALPATLRSLRALGVPGLGERLGGLLPGLPRLESLAFDPSALAPDALLRLLGAAPPSLTALDIDGRCRPPGEPPLASALLAALPAPLPATLRSLRLALPGCCRRPPDPDQRLLPELPALARLEVAREALPPAALAEQRWPALASLALDAPSPAALADLPPAAPLAALALRLERGLGPLPRPLEGPNSLPHPAWALLPAATAAGLRDLSLGVGLGTYGELVLGMTAAARCPRLVSFAMWAAGPGPTPSLRERARRPGAAELVARTLAALPLLRSVAVARFAVPAELPAALRDGLPRSVSIALQGLRPA